MKILFLILICALGVNAQTEQISLKITKLFNEFPKKYDFHNVSYCIEGMFLEDPALEAKLLKFQTQFDTFGQKFLVILQNALFGYDVCSKCYKDICSNFTPIAEQFVDEIKDNVKPCFPKPSFVDMLVRLIKKFDKYVCQLELEDIIDWVNIGGNFHCFNETDVENCKQLTDIDPEKVLTDFCSIDFSGFLECARKPLSTCVSESHVVIKTVDFSRSFINEECKPLTSGGAQITVLSSAVAISLFLIQKIVI